MFLRACGLTDTLDLTSYKLNLMSTDTLKEAIMDALVKLGHLTHRERVPELKVMNSSANPTHLTRLLLDSNNVLRENGLLKLVSYLKENRDANQNNVVGWTRREMEPLLSNAELRQASRLCSAGLVILTRDRDKVFVKAVQGSGVPRCDDNEGDGEYLPLISLAAGYHNGPIKTALEVLFRSHANRGRSRNAISTHFLGHLLALWRDIIAYWIEGKVATVGGATMAISEPFKPVLCSTLISDFPTPFQETEMETTQVFVQYSH